VKQNNSTLFMAFSYSKGVLLGCIQSHLTGVEKKKLFSTHGWTNPHTEIGICMIQHMPNSKR
jgi:hypothetical protein